LEGYLGRATLNKLRMDRRTETRRARRLAELGQPLVSEFTRRAARPADDDDDLHSIATAPVSFLRPDELELMSWVADGWTLREIATTLQINDQAAKKRVQRIRA